MTVVVPPAAAAASPVAQPSQSVRPSYVGVDVDISARKDVPSRASISSFTLPSISGSIETIVPPSVATSTCKTRRETTVPPGRSHRSESCSRLQDGRLEQSIEDVNGGSDVTCRH